MKLIVLLALLVSITQTPASANESLGTGFYTANVVIVPVDDQIVQGLIVEDGLFLADQDFAPKGKHPIIFLFGDQSDVHPVVNGAPLPSPFGPYKEFAVLVPFVRTRTSGSEVFSYMPKRYLDNARAAAAGFYYGMNKELAGFKLAESYDKLGGSVLTYAVRSLVLRRELVTGYFQQRKSYDSRIVEENFGRIREAIELPLINRRLGKFVCGIQTWDDSTLAIVPYRSVIKSSGAFLKGELPEMTGSLALDEAPLGSFRMSGRWSMTPPFGCGSAK